MNRIKEYLEEQGRSQKWLAGKVGVTKQTMNNWCLGKSNPTFPQMNFVAQHLQIRDVRKMYKEDKDV